MVLVLPLLINTLLVSYGWQVLLGNAGVVNSWLIASHQKIVSFGTH